MAQYKSFVLLLINKQRIIVYFISYKKKSAAWIWHGFDIWICMSSTLRFHMRVCVCIDVYNCQN